MPVKTLCKPSYGEQSCSTDLFLNKQTCISDADICPPLVSDLNISRVEATNGTRSIHFYHTMLGFTPYINNSLSDASLTLRHSAASRASCLDFGVMNLGSEIHLQRPRGRCGRAASRIVQCLMIKATRSGNRGLHDTVSPRRYSIFSLQNQILSL